MGKSKLQQRPRAAEPVPALQKPTSLLSQLLLLIYVNIFHLVNFFIPWHRLPTLLGVLNLEALRIELRKYNLFDGYTSPDAQGSKADEPEGAEEKFIHARHSDGKFNDLDRPRMGSACMRFGRNFPRRFCQKPTEKDLYTPNPRLVSLRFMTRRQDAFKPATTLNLLAAAWIQFQTHDWFAHDRNDDDSFHIPLPQGDKWSGDKWGTDMRLPKTRADEPLDPSDKKCPGYQNKNTPWWDASHIYGSSEEVTRKLRRNHVDGKLVLRESAEGGAVLPPDSCHIGSFDNGPETGFNDNWWVGMEMLHTLFALEHNSICDMLRAHYPTWTGLQIFDTARMINSAVMAKIHTVEWTPGILAHPALQVGMDANWWGLAGQTITDAIGHFPIIAKASSIIDEAVSGIPGSGVEHDGAPYSMTEEFVSVYRMHSLVPDNIAFFKATSGEWRETIPIKDTIFTDARRPLQSGLNFGDVFYSFGINYPGQITNNNYPNFLCDLTTPEGIHRDMGTVDILRDRERGVPRYCQFRRLLRMPAPKTFEELTGGNRTLAAALSEVYEGDIEKVDTLVGSHSEPLPEGFGFSETAFRIFIVMASRRLKSDRFIAGRQWSEETYTKPGMKWVQKTGMKDVLIRHFPELKPVLDKSGNVFAPWTKLPESVKYAGIETNAPP